MQILSSEDSLRSYLLKQHGTKLQIVSAFAYGTAGVVKQLKSQSNAVELIVGTINAFTDPDFIEHAARALPKGLWVDFRGQQSIHWKLYLIAPKTVIIGSANLTGMGLDLTRDTCVVVKNQSLYDDYLHRVANLKSRSSEILRPTSKKFEGALAAYRRLHERSQVAKQRAEAKEGPSPRGLPTLKEWLEAGNSRLSLFIWQRELTQAEKTQGGAIARKASKSAGKTAPKPSSVRRPYKHLFAAELDGGRPKFAPGTVLLSAKETGSHIKFIGIDVVQRQPGSGRDYYISLRKRGGHPELFQLTPAMKAGLKKLVVGGEDLRGAVTLNREQLLELAALD